MPQNQPNSLFDPEALVALDALEAEAPSESVESRDDYSQAPAYSYGQPSARAGLLNLEKALIQKFNFSKEGAKAVSRGIVDPAEVRNLLANPFKIRVPGGRLLAVATRAFSPAVLPDPSNPRLTITKGCSFLGAGGAAAPRKELGSALGGNELRLTVDSEQHMISVATENAHGIKQENPSVIHSVAEQGVMLPVYGCVTEIYHADTKTSRWVIVTPDGSSRVTGCHLAMGIGVREVVYDYTSDDSRMRDILTQVSRFAGMPKEDEESKAWLEALQKNRVHTVPMILLIGFDPDAGSTMDFATAVEALVGLVHVARPTAWPKAGERDLQATAGLRELESILPADELAYLAGELSTAEAIKAGFGGYLDQRAAHALRVFTHSDKTHRHVYRNISKGIRAVMAGSHGLLSSDRKIAQRTNQEIRMKAGLELAIRPIRTKGCVQADIDKARAAMERLYEGDLVYTDWSASLDTPDNLLAAALAELQPSEGAEGAPGPKCRELAILGSFWLCITGGLERASAQNQEKEKDRDWREPAQIIRPLLRTPHGLQIFYRAIVEGRKAQDEDRLGTLRLMATKPDGTDQVDNHGRVMPVGTAWLRGLARGAEVEEEAAKGTSMAGDTPIEVALRLQGETVKALETAKKALEAAIDVKVAPDSTQTIMNVYGMNGSVLTEMEGFLKYLSRKVNYYQELAERLAASVVVDEPALPEAVDHD